MENDEANVGRQGGIQGVRVDRERLRKLFRWASDLEFGKSPDKWPIGRQPSLAIPGNPTQNSHTVSLLTLTNAPSWYSACGIEEDL